MAPPERPILSYFTHEWVRISWLGLTTKQIQPFVDSGQLERRIAPREEGDAGRRPVEYRLAAPR